MAYNLILSLHILFIITWLGTDLGVFYSSLVLMNRRLSPQIRHHIRRLAEALDMLPRVSMLMTIGLGLTLGYMSWGLQEALGSVAIFFLAAMWVIVLLWAIILVDAFLRRREAEAAGGATGALHRYLLVVQKGDLAMRIILLAGLVAFITIVVTGQSPFVGAWLNWKVFVMGVILVGGIGLRLPVTNYVVPLVNIVRNGSTPKEEAELRRALFIAYPFVFLIWGGLLANIVIAVIKPM